MLSRLLYEPLREAYKAQRSKKGIIKMSTITSKMSTTLLKGDAMMKIKTTCYWVATAAIALETLVGGITDLVHGQAMLFFGGSVVQIIVHEGYPVYLLTILGAWKLLGGIALLVPRFPRLKEWAYAGIFFELTGALVSGIMRGGDPGTVIWPTIILVIITLASWALRPQGRILGNLFPAQKPA
jgi:uncharacterized membrane protein YphA (DoxX/SURF4 family)